MEQSLDVTRTRLHSNLRPIAGNFTRLPRKLKKAITTNYCSELLPLIKSGVVYIATSGRVDSSYKRIGLWGPTLWIRKPLADSLGLTREKSRIRYISLK